MSEYTIVEVGDPRDWRNDYGTYHAFPLKLEDADGKTHFPVEWSRKFKGDDPPRPPVIGERIAGDIKASTHGDKIKVDYEATKALNGGAPASPNPSGRKSREWQPESQRDPERSARILRQHSQSVAVEMLVGNGEKNFNVADVAALADELDADVLQAAQKAGGVSETPESGTGSMLDGRTPPAAQERQGNAEYLHKLLGDAGFDGAQVTVVQGYVEATYDSSQREALVKALEDASRQAWCKKVLTEGAEKWSGKPLPTATSDDDIPF